MAASRDAGVLPFRLVDAFAERAYAGNSAGVVLHADVLDERQMQAIAREVHSSETAFISRIGRSDGPPRIRWFTPGVEVGFCGHATLAAAHAMHETALIHREESAVVFASAAGLLELSAEPLSPDDENPLWWLALPSPDFEPARANAKELADILRLSIQDVDPIQPMVRTRDGDLIVLVGAWNVLMEIRPDFGRLGEWCRARHVRGVLAVTTKTLSPAVQVTSRFFAPAAGVDEDQVTGSVHGPLCAFLVQSGLVRFEGQRAVFHCFQGQPDGRGGLVRAMVSREPEGLRVGIAGRCRTTIRGEIAVPPHA